MRVKSTTTIERKIIISLCGNGVPSHRYNGIANAVASDTIPLIPDQDITSADCRLRRFFEFSSVGYLIYFFCLRRRSKNTIPILMIRAPIAIIHPYHTNIHILSEGMFSKIILKFNPINKNINPLRRNVIISQIFFERFFVSDGKECLVNLVTKIPSTTTAMTPET